MLALSVFLHKLKPQILADPKTRRSQAKREAIVDAATLLFNRRGVKATTLADIASSVGLVTNSVTYYYRKKEDLATVCFLRAIDAFNVMVSVASQESTVQVRMHRLLQQYTGLLAHIEDSKHPTITCVLVWVWLTSCCAVCAPTEAAGPAPTRATTGSLKKPPPARPGLFCG